jgi:hypothetical protein
MNTKETMGLRSVVDYFEKNQLKHSVDWGQGLVRTGFAMKNTRFDCLIAVNAQDNCVQLTGLIPIGVPSEKRREVCDLLALINWRLALGKFQMDLDNGELRFQGTALYSQGNLADEVMRQLIGRCAVSIDNFFPAFAAVIFANKSPKEAFDGAFNRGHLRPQDEAEIASPKPRIRFD